MMGAMCRKISFGFIGIAILCLGGGTQYALQLASTSTTDETAELLSEKEEINKNNFKYLNIKTSKN